MFSNIHNSIPTPTELHTILQNNHPASNHEVFVLIKQQLKQAISPVQAKELIALLPHKTLSFLPETQCLLAKLFRCIPQRLAPLPVWYSTHILPAVELEWMRTKILRQPDLLSASSALILSEINPCEVSDPEIYISALSKQVSLQYYAVPHLRQLLYNGLIAPYKARKFLFDLLLVESMPVVKAAIEELGKPWSAIFPSPEAQLSVFLEQNNNLTKAALTTLSQWQGVDFLLKYALNRYYRRYAISLINAPLNTFQISQLLKIAEEDPYFFGKQVVTLLRNQHRRGHHFSKLHIDALFQLFLYAPEIILCELTEIIRPFEKRWLHCLESLHSSDYSWSRQIALLELLNTAKGNAFLFKCASCGDFSELQILLLDALGNNGYRKAEALALELLYQQYTVPALRIIRKIGGSLSRKVLREHLNTDKEIQGLDYQEALACALAIENNLPQAIKHIDASLLDAMQLTMLSAIASDEAIELLFTLIEVNPATALIAIQQLGNSADARSLERLSQQLLTEQGPAVVEAIQHIGKRLFSMGSLYPQVLNQAKNDIQAGDFVLVECLINRCNEMALAEEKLLHLLEILQKYHFPNAIRLLPFLQHKNPQVQKYIITCLLHNHCYSVVNKLVVFLQKDNIYTLRAALEGFGKMRALGLSKEIVQCLNHPNMNIKKIAAKVLSQAGSIESVPLILDWITKHDNTGLQKLLADALKAILDDGYVATVLAYLTQKNKSTEIKSLLLALDYQLDALVVLKGLQKNSPWAELLLSLIRTGEYHLANSQSRDFLEYKAWQMDIALTPEKVDDLPIKKLPLLETWLMQFLNTHTRYSKDTLKQWKKSIGTLSSFQISLLRRQLSQLIKQLDIPQHNELALTLLEMLVDNLQAGEKVQLTQALQYQLDREQLPWERLLGLLTFCTTLLPVKTLVLALQNPSLKLKIWALNALISSQSLDKTLAEEILKTALPSLNQHQLVLYMLQQQWHSQLLSIACSTRPVFIIKLRKCWQAPVISNTETLLVNALSTASEDAIEPLLDWLTSLKTHNINQILLGYLSAQNKNYRKIAILYFQCHPSTNDEKAIEKLLHHQQYFVREAASSVLLAWTGTHYTAQIAHLYLQGKICNGEALHLDIQVLSSLQTKALDTAGLHKYIALIARSKLNAVQKLTLFFPFLVHQNKEIQVLAKTHLTNLPKALILSHIWSFLEAGQWGYLDLLGNYIPAKLALFLEQENNARHALLMHWSTLYYPLLGDYLLDILLSITEPQSREIILIFLGKLADWQRASSRKKLLDYLNTALKQKALQAICLQAFEHGIKELEIEEQVEAIFTLLNASTQSYLLPKLTICYLFMPSIAERIEPKYQAILQHQLQQLASDRNEETARRALKLLVENKHENYLEILEDALQHPKSRVRIYAHRLLRKQAPREYYLEATLVLLYDKELALRCSAIRTLAFRGYLPAVKGIADQLFIQKKNVNNVAHAGLVTLGKEALPSLQYLLNHTRPDQRGVIVDVMDEINTKF